MIGTSGYADIIAPMLDDFDEPAVLLGHSFGGRIAVQLAVSRPDRVGRLILLGVPLLRRPQAGRVAPPLPYRIVRTLAKIGLVGNDRMEQARQR